MSVLFRPNGTAYTVGVAQPVRMRVLARNRPLSPSMLRTLADRSPGPTLVVVPTASPAVKATAARLGWSLIAMNPQSMAGPEGLVVLPSGLTVPIGPVDPVPAATPSPKPGRVPWGGLTLMRLLAEGATGTQTQLAALAGVTQARVSQVLKELIPAGLVSPGRGPKGHYAATDPERMARHWLASYPGPDGISTYWYGLDDPIAQARAVVALLRNRSEPGVPEPTVAVSGDVAADQVSPWRRPQHAILYSRYGADLAGAGLTPTTEQEATLELTVPRDAGVWPTSSRPGVTVWSGPPDLPLADPLQILWDVWRSPAADSGEGADRLLSALTSHVPPAHRAER